MLLGDLPVSREAGARVALPVHGLLLVAALAAAVVAQGGYYLPGRILATVLVGLALVAALWQRRLSRTDAPLVLFACAALAGWALLRAALAGSLPAAFPTVASVFCLAAALLVAARTDQRTLTSAAIGIGVLVAATGWIAVAWRIPSWTTVADGLVRAASTLTYPNAAAALLACLAILAISRADALATYLMLVGLGATLSRAGFLALAVGLVVLSIRTDVRSVVRHAAPPALGALVAIAALAPSFPVTAPARPLLALLGLAAGFGIAVGLNRLPTKVLAGVSLTGLALAGVALATAGNVFSGRIGLSSPDRGGATSAALDLVAAHPLSGTGPGPGWFSWTTADGHVRIAHYIHNEYLQILVQLGAIGLALTLCLLAAILLTVRRAHPAALAALTALAVHSGFDFLWHIPAILLTAGLLIGSPIQEET